MHNIRTLEGLNRHWSNYLEEYYHTSPHAGIREYYESMGVSVPEGGISPVQEWNRDSRPLTFLDASVVAEAFLHHEERLVDKGACINICPYPSEFYSEMLTNIIAQIVKECVSI